jgi:isoleucyl-tRNA synthetase
VAHAELIREELNVEAVEFIDRADEYVSYRVKPNFVSLGKRLGGLMKATQAAIGAEAPERLKRALDERGEVRLAVEGREVTLSRDDVVVGIEAREGFAAAGGAAGVVVLDTKLDERLVDEGLYRELLSRVQARRKELHLDYVARIRLGLSGSPRLLGIARDRIEHLKRETLALEVVLDAPVGGDRAEVAIEGESLAIEVALVAGR